ncbi:hypothetical protein [Thermomonospora echinospora]|nr:hypothetical protein [Thermomonospora echinospora]
MRSAALMVALAAADPSSPAPQPANNPWVTRNGDFSDDPPF